MAGTPADAEALAREMFERACPDDTFDALKHRAAGRLRAWIRAAQAIADGRVRRL